MMNLAHLVADLQKVNVAALSAKSGVSTKTIYRLRTDLGHQPNLATLHKLDVALSAMLTPRKSRKAAAE